MSVLEKCKIWDEILMKKDAASAAETLESQLSYPHFPLRAKGAPLSPPPTKLPVWGRDEWVPATPMVVEWFSFANGWNEYSLGRRALPYEEMRDPWIGLRYYLFQDIDDDEDRRRHLNSKLTTDMKFSLEALKSDPDYLAFDDPRPVLFSIPILGSISGIEFLVFEAKGQDQEPKVFLNDYVATNIEAMLDWLIVG